MTLRPIAGRAFAERVRDEMAAAWLAGEPDAIPPVQLRPPGERQAELAAIAAQAARYHAARAAEFDEARRAELAADAGRLAALRELVGDAGVAASLGAAAPNLDSEGFSQRSNLDSRFSQHIDGALALAPAAERAAIAPRQHAGHGCCRDETLPYGTITLVGRRTVYDADEDAMTFSKEREAITFANSCRRWRCPCCKWRLRSRNRARAIRGALRPTGKTWFVTITLDQAHPMYRAFRDAALDGDRIVLAPGRKPKGARTFRGDRRARKGPGSRTDPTSSRISRKPQVIGAPRCGHDPRHVVMACPDPRRLTTARAVLRPHRGVVEPGGRVLADSDPQADTLISVRYAAQSWNRLRLMLVRHFGHPPDYYRALELHPGTGANAGIAHLHLLIRTHSVAEWFMRFQGANSWREMLARAGFGVVTKVEQVKTREDAARYVTKMTAAYTSKDMAELPRWTRRGSWSRDWSDWVAPTPIAGFAWQLARAPEDAIREALTATGFALLDPADFRVPATGPP